MTAKSHRPEPHGGSGRLDALDLSDPQFRADPYPTYERLRGEAPVVRNDAMGYWLLTKYDDVAAAPRRDIDTHAHGASSPAPGRSGPGAGPLGPRPDREAHCRRWRSRSSR